MGIREGILNLVSAAQLRMSGGNSKNTGGRIPGLENSRLLRLYVLPRSENREEEIKSGNARILA